MTLADFTRYLTRHNCEVKPLNKSNLTGNALLIINKTNGVRYYFQIYKIGEVSDAQIFETCTKLGIPLPPGF